MHEFRFVFPTHIQMIYIYIHIINIYTKILQYTYILAECLHSRSEVPSLVTSLRLPSPALLAKEKAGYHAALERYKTVNLCKGHFAFFLGGGVNMVHIEHSKRKKKCMRIWVEQDILWNSHDTFPSGSRGLTLKNRGHQVGIYSMVYSFSQNHGSGKWLSLKGNFYWRYTHFSLNRRKGTQPITIYCNSKQTHPNIIPDLSATGDAIFKLFL